MGKPKWFHSAILVATAAAFCLAADAAGQLLLANFDFEAADSPAAWKELASKDVKPSIRMLDEDNPHSGRSSLKFSATAQGESAQYVFTGITLPADHGKRVRVRLFARGANLNDGDAEINLLERDRSKVLGWCGGKTALVSIGSGGDWKEYTAEVPLHDEARVLTMFIRINNPAPGKTVWVDDISLEFVEPE